MTMMAVRPVSSSTAPGRAKVSALAVNAATPSRRSVLNSPPASQSYYWSKSWQVFEARASRDIALGDVREFDNADDALAWLDSI